MNDDAFASRYGRWAVIAGASEGIGEHFARQLAARGLDLVLIARRAEPLEALASDLRTAAGAEVRTLAADLAEPAATSEVVGATEGLEVGLGAGGLQPGGGALGGEQLAGQQQRAGVAALDEARQEAVGLLLVQLVRAHTARHLAPGDGVGQRRVGLLLGAPLEPRFAGRAGGEAGRTVGRANSRPIRARAKK